MNNIIKINTTLFLLLLLISGWAMSYQLGNFSALPDPQGVISDMRGVVLWDIRFPRIALAILSGIALAVAGNAMQGVFQNPLASPGLLGSSSGATAASVAVLYYFSMPTIVLLLAGVSGALLSFLFVYILAYQRSSTMIILSGVAVNVLFSASITLLLSNAESPWALAELYRWLQGSFAQARLDLLSVSLPIVIVGLYCLYSQRRYINFLTLGEETTITMGINIKRSFFITSFGCALLVGAVIPQTGVIGFVGLIAPHFARMLLHKLPSQLYLTSALIGALLMLMADLTVQYLMLFQRIHIGTLTAILGAPFLIWILWTQDRRQFYDRD